MFVPSVVSTVISYFPVSVGIVVSSVNVLVVPSGFFTVTVVVPVVDGVTSMYKSVFT